MIMRVGRLRERPVGGVDARTTVRRAFIIK